MMTKDQLILTWTNEGFSPWTVKDCLESRLVRSFYIEQINDKIPEITSKTETIRDGE